MAYENNEFVRRLRELQQDGRAAISVPTAWLNTRPLLEVTTPLDKDLDSIVASLTGPGTEARWHFFVGSPGNGKSAATGKLVRTLSEAGWAFSDEHRIPLKDLDPAEIPYVLHAYKPTQKHATVWIAQDASVVPDPFSKNIDPIQGLEDLVKDAAVRGVSLVVCTNRGVIESLYSRYHVDPQVNTEPWFEAIDAAVKGVANRKLRFGSGAHQTSADFHSTVLDTKSLVIRSDVLSRVIERSIAQSEWQVCARCEASPLCPFFQNRAWLSDETRRVKFLRVLQRAELLSGRVIVFREALALLSLILSGCPHDDASGNPCNWVHAAVIRKDIFLLLSRRIYSVLFSSYAPLGLEHYEPLLERQASTLKLLAEAGGRTGVASGMDIQNLPSSDVGVPGLLGAAGVLAELDPFAGPIPEAKQMAWDQESRFASSEAGGSPLEGAAINEWTALRDIAEQRSDIGGDAVGWLERHITSFTFRAAALSEGYTTFDRELDELLAFLASPDLATAEGVRRLLELERSLAAALKADSRGVRIAPYAELTGQWVDSNLKTKVSRSELGTRGNMAFPLEIGEFKLSLPGRAYAWLRYRELHNLSLNTFPGAFLTTARDALARAAAEGGYSMVTDDVSIRVTLESEETQTLSRVHGLVICDE